MVWAYASMASNGVGPTPLYCTASTAPRPRSCSRCFRSGRRRRWRSMRRGSRSQGSRRARSRRRTAAGPSSQATAASAVVNRRRRYRRRGRARTTKSAAASATTHATARRTCDMSSSGAPFHEGRVLGRPQAALVWEHRWPGGQRQVAWLAECGGSRRAAHSCGSASVSHRLPPSPGRSPGTARNIRVARNRCREGTLVRNDDHDATTGDGPGVRGGARATAPRASWHAGVWLVWALAAAACIELAPSPVYVALVIGDRVGRGVDAHATRPVRRARSRCCWRSASFFAVVRDAAHRARPRTASATSCSPRPTSRCPQLLGGFTVGGTVELPVMLQSLAEGFAIVGVMARVRRVQRGGVALRAGASRRPRAFHELGLVVVVGARVRAVDDHRPSTTSARPTAPAPVAGRATRPAAAPDRPGARARARTRGHARGVDGRARVRARGRQSARPGRGVVRASRRCCSLGGAFVALVGQAEHRRPPCSARRRRRARRCDRAGVVGHAPHRATARAACAAADWIVAGVALLAPVRDGVGVVGRRRQPRVVRQPARAGRRLHAAARARALLPLLGRRLARSRRRSAGVSAIAFRDVSFAYPDAPRARSTTSTSTCAPGELLLVVGASGSGKSTLLRAVNGLVPHTQRRALRRRGRGVRPLDAHAPPARARRRRRVRRTRIPRRSSSSTTWSATSRSCSRTSGSRRRRCAAGSRRCSTRSASRTSATATRRRCRAVSGSGARSPARWPPRRRRSCSTSRRRSSTRRAPTTCSPRSPASTPTSARRCVLAEHRLERAAPLADRAVLVDDGRIGVRRRAAARCSPTTPARRASPAWVALLGWDPLPLTVRDARRTRRAGPARPSIRRRARHRPLATPGDAPASRARPRVALGGQPGAARRRPRAARGRRRRAARPQRRGQDHAAARARRAAPPRRAARVDAPRARSRTCPRTRTRMLFSPTVRRELAETLRLLGRTDHGAVDHWLDALAPHRPRRPPPAQPVRRRAAARGDRRGRGRRRAGAPARRADARHGRAVAHCARARGRAARGRPAARSCSPPTTSSSRRGSRRTRSCSATARSSADGDARDVLAGSLFAPQVLRVLPPFLTVEEVGAELARSMTLVVEPPRTGAAAAASVRSRCTSLMVCVGAAAFLYPFWLPATALPSQAHSGDAPLVAALVGALGGRRGHARGAAGHDERRDRRHPRRARGGRRPAAPRRPARRRQRHLLPRRARGRRLRPALRPAARPVRDGRVGDRHRRDRAVAAVPDARARRGWARAPGCSACSRARLDPRLEVVALAAYGWVWGFLYGAIMNLWFWPFHAAARSTGTPASTSARRCTTTGRSTWPRRSRGTPPPRSRTRVLILVTGLVLMRTLRRFAHRLDPAVEFDPLPVAPSRTGVSTAESSPDASRLSGGREELGDELVEGGAAFGGGEIAEEDGGAGVARAEVAAASPSATRRRRGPPARRRSRAHHKHRRHREEAARRAGRVPSSAVGSCMVAAPVPMSASTRNHVLRSSDPIDRSRLADAAPKQLHGRRSLRTIRRTSTTVNAAKVSSASQLGHDASTNRSSTASTSS